MGCQGCSAHVPGQVCTNGFPLPYANKVKCSECGTAHVIPWCLREDLPERWLDDTGAPRFRVNVALTTQQDTTK